MALTLEEAARETGPRAVHQAAYPDTPAYEAQIHGLKEIADMLRSQLDNARQDGDRWREQAQAEARA